MKNLFETIIRNTSATVKIKITVIYTRSLDAGLNPITNPFGAIPGDFISRPFIDKKCPFYYTVKVRIYSYKSTKEDGCHEHDYSSIPRSGFYGRKI